MLHKINTQTQKGPVINREGAVRHADKEECHPNESDTAISMPDIAQRSRIGTPGILARLPDSLLKGMHAGSRKTPPPRHCLAALGALETSTG